MLIIPFSSCHDMLRGNLLVNKYLNCDANCLPVDSDVGMIDLWMQEGIIVFVRIIQMQYNLCPFAYLLLFASRRVKK